MSGLVGNPFLLTSAGAAGYQISRSLRFNSSDSAYLSRTPASAGNRKTWTWAGWVKRSELSSSGVYPLMTSYVDTQNYSVIDFQNDTLRVVTGTTGAGEQGKKTTQIFRDPSSWYHIVIASDNLSTLKIYVNGSEVTAFSTNATVTADWHFNTTNPQWIGREQYSTSNNYFSGLLADVFFIDGQALDPSSFVAVSATTGQLVPKAYTGSYGTNGFRLAFADNSNNTATTLGKDSSPNGNNWTPNNLSVTAGAGNDSLVDTPTSYGTDTGAGGEVRGNYATFNPLARVNQNAFALSNGNLDATTPSDNLFYNTITTIPFTAGGSYYCEITCTAQTTPGDSYIGLWTVASVESSSYPAVNFAAYRSSGEIINFSGTSQTSGATWGAGDIISVAVNVNAGTVRFYKNGVAQGANPSFSFSAGTPVYLRVGTDNSTGANGFSLNAGQRLFAYTAPSGFKALCDTNLPAPVVAKPSTVMDVKLWTGNGSSQNITGLAFNPDFVWIKQRSSIEPHILSDVVRGSTNALQSNTTAAEIANEGPTSFNSDGFSLGAGWYVNRSGYTYVGWAFDAGSNTVSNTAGSITSQVRANASAGFSIVTASVSASASGPTIGHGLGVTPALVIGKNRSAAINWYVWNASLPANNKLELQSTAAATTSTTTWGAMTSSTLQMGATGTAVNVSWVVSGTQDFVFYCFAPVAGYSSGFSYTGNGSTDGSFVYLGFRPRLLLLKCSSTTGNWTLLDTAREGYNVDNDPLYPNLSDAEGTTDLLDITSNGFKLRTTDASVNSSGATYVGYAWAEAPFAYSRAR